MGFDIHIAKTEEDLKQLYQLRYKVFVEELGRPEKYADHELKEIKDPLDEIADNMIAVDEGRIVGAMRFNFCSQIKDSLYKDVYRLDKFGSFYPDYISINTKLIVTSEKRHRNVALELAMTLYTNRVSKVNFNVIDCYPFMVPFYLKFGYRFYTSNVIHPEFGEVVSLVLVKDSDYLKRIGSPLAKLDVVKNDIDESAVIFYDKNFGHIHEQRKLEFSKEYQIQLT
jgi:hypothetical protein